MEILDRLAGKKALILGNHDPEDLSDAVREMFEDIASYRESMNGERKVILCHYPVFSFRDHYFGTYHLYGHVHSSFAGNTMVAFC